MTAEVTGVHIHARPSAGVLATAVRYILAGWARLVAKTGGGYDLPTSSGPQTYSVRKIGDHITCTCPAGVESRHCWHVTLIQLMTGLSFYWPLEQRIVPFEAQEAEPEPVDPMPDAITLEDAPEVQPEPTPVAAPVATATRKPSKAKITKAAAALAAELMESGIRKVSDNVFIFEGHPDFGILARNWKALADVHGSEEALKTVALAAATTHTVSNGFDALTGAELNHQFGRSRSICWDTGIFVPRQTQFTAAA